MDTQQILKDVLVLEGNALLRASERIRKEDADHMLDVFSSLRELGGRAFFIGVGKSGLIASKMASTFTSLGLPSHFLHPTEALHGDLGQISKNDIVFLISNSGTTEEILKLLPFLPLEKERLIGLVGNLSSPIAKACQLVFDCSVEKEACINNQAPTTSTTLTMALSDALAVLYENLVGLSREGFAQNHPGGLLGKSLMLKVAALMISREECPQVSRQATMQEVILEMTKKPTGMCAVVDSDKKLLGIIVEGDIRRTFAAGADSLSTSVESIMNKKPVIVSDDSRAYDALCLMEKGERLISVLPVVDNAGFFSGQVRLHDLLREGFALNKK